MTYSRIASDGSVPLQLSISGQAVSVTNKSYEEWRKDKAEALDAFARLSRALQDVPETFPVSHLDLSYKDVFWWDGEWQSGCVKELLARGKVAVYDRRSPLRSQACVVTEALHSSEIGVRWMSGFIYMAATLKTISFLFQESPYLPLAVLCTSIDDDMRAVA